VKQILAFRRQQAGKRFFSSGGGLRGAHPYIYHQARPSITRGPFRRAIGKHPDGCHPHPIVRRLKMTPERWGQLKGLYDGEVEHLDEMLWRAREGLASRGWLATRRCSCSPITARASSKRQHGHAYGQYAELTNVPLVLFASGLGTARRFQRSSAIPMSCRPSSTHGRPARRSRAGRKSAAHDPARGTVAAARGAIGVRAQLLASARATCTTSSTMAAKESLFDTAADPAEKTELKDQRPLALRYFRDLAGIYLAHRAKWHAATWAPQHQPSGFAAATE